MAINVGQLFATIELRDQLTLRLAATLLGLRRAESTIGRRTSRIDNQFVRLAASVTASGAAMAVGITASAARIGVGLASSAAKVSLFGAAAAGATHAVLALGAGLAPLAGGLAAVPGAVALSVAGFGALGLALYGIADATSAAFGDDQDKLDKALAKLSQSARAAILEVRELRPALDGVRLASQEAFFGQLAGAVTALAAALLGPLHAGLSGVASDLGAAARSVVDFVRSSDSVRAVEQVFASTRHTIIALSQALWPLLGGFRDLTVVGAQFTASLAPEIAQALARVGVFLSQASADGRAWAWMVAAVETLRQLGRIALDVWQILSGLFEAMRTAGGDALGVLGALVSSVADFVTSDAGQQALVAVFVALAQAGQALGPVLAALVVGVGQLAPALGGLALIVGPILTSAIQAVVPALASLEPGIVAILSAVGRAVEVLGPSLTLLGEAVAAAMVAASPFVDELAAAIVALMPGLIAVVVNVGQVFAALAPALEPVGTALAQIMVELAPLLPTLADLAALIVTQLAPYVVDLASVLADLLLSVAPLLPPLLDLVTMVLPPMLDLLRSIATLLRGDFASALGFADQAVLGFLRVVDNLGWALLTGLWNGLVAGYDWIKSQIIGFFSSILPDWVRQALGIQSPSRVFAQIGRYTMLGLRDGMLAGQRPVLQAAQRISDRLSGSFSPDLSGSVASTGARLSAPGRGPTMIFHVTAVNPLPETTSETVNRGLQMAGALGVA
ncbi:hypothetical protein ACIBH1_45075 [Nonomuraea sp. NPDC050663]|uniref:hypothetical protein n=1 Tax=Nonomuraea sp. NPDC050663 TaxID=3364370 RepID=UPI0037A33F64